MTLPQGSDQALDSAWRADVVSARTQAQQLVSTSYERSALTLEEYAEVAIGYAESRAECDRRAATRRRVMILRDAWGPLLKESFSSWTTPEIQTRVLGSNKQHLDLSDNVAKRIWTELSVLYKRPPRRTTRKAPRNGERYMELMEDTDFHTFWMTVELMVQACNECLIWPTVIDWRGEKLIQHCYATPDKFTVIAADVNPQLLECVVLLEEYTDLSGKEHKQYVLWTDEWHAVFERRAGVAGREGELTRVDLVPAQLPDKPEDDSSAANPYGRIPMHLIRRVPWQDVTLDCTSGEDLMDGTIKGGEARQFFRYFQKMSGFKMLFATGQVDEVPDTLLDTSELGRITGHELGLHVVDFQLDLKAQQEVIQTDQLSLAAGRGISPELYRKQSYATARGGKQAERSLDETRVKMYEPLSRAERVHYRTFCVVADVHGIENPPDKDARLSLDYAPLAHPAEPEKQALVDQQDVAMGLESHITILMKRDPSLTYRDAQAIIKRNWEDIATVQRMKVTHNIASKPTNESRTAEANGATGPMVRDGAASDSQSEMQFARVSAGNNGR